MRITKEIVQKQIDTLNKITGHNNKPWSNGKASIGTYYRSGAYGGHALLQIINESGGVNDVFNSGFMKTKELYNRIRAFSLGYQTRKREEIK